MTIAENELPYWMGLAHIGNWRTEKINRLFAAVLKEKQMSLEDFFNLDKADLERGFSLEEADYVKLAEIKAEVPNLAFLAESLIEQGFDIVPLNSPDYSFKLKNHLKLKYAPPVLYLKGNKDLLNFDSIAVVGSRKASPEGLDFTEKITHKAILENKLVVSGFAAGIDQYALESALKYKGKSIVVLPQGVTTFTSGIKQYYQQIWEGDVLVLSTFHPKARWTPQLAMSRNPIIYGLADQIYIADCEEKGGTWSGAIDGIRKGRTLFVREPAPGLKTGLHLLIQKGAIAVNADSDTGKLSAQKISEDKTTEYSADKTKGTASGTQIELF